MSDRLFAHESEAWHLPVEKASVRGYVKHVHCEGSRSHVVSYGGYMTWNGIACIETCSVKNCIVNHEAKQRMKALGIKP